MSKKGSEYLCHESITVITGYADVNKELSATLETTRTSILRDIAIRVVSQQRAIKRSL